MPDLTALGPHLPMADAAREGFRPMNLVVLAIVLVIAVPALQWVRRRASQRRIERWSREEGWTPTDPNDPNNPDDPSDRRG